MAVRNIVKIDREKCNGCGQCANACAEGAIQIIDGKAVLVSEIYCDGLGACIGHCPVDAITIEQRDAADFDEEATKAHLTQDKKATTAKIRSQLGQWPVQLKLVSPSAPYFANADLLLVADCVAFAVGDFHSRFLKGRSIAVGCPKLDDSQLYVEKLAAILQANKLNSLTVVHMEVPCCHGLTRIAKEALARNKIEMAFEDVTIDLHGNVSRTQKVPC